MRIRTRYAAMAACLLVSSAIIGCEGGRTRPPAVSVRMLHAAPERGPLDFLREQRSESQLDYRQSTNALSFDADQYDFNIRSVDPNGNTSTLLGSFSADLVADNDYLLVITESSGVLTPIVAERPARDSASTEVWAVHAAPTLDEISIYVVPEDANAATGTPLGTLSFGESVDPVERDAGDYRLILTEPGNTANTLLTSSPFTLEEGQAYTYAILGPSNDSLAPISVVAISSVDSTLLFDENLQSALHVVNAAADGNPRDVYIDEDFSAPLIAAVPYATVTEDVPVASGSRKVSVTPAGNPAVIEADNTATYARSRYGRVLIGGEPGDVTAINVLDDRRRIADRARIMFLNGATQFEPLEVFAVTPGTDVSDRLSSLVLSAPGMSSRLTLSPGDYEIILRDSDTDVVVGGPEEFTVEAGGIYSILSVNGAEAGTVDLVYFEDFAAEVE